MLYMHACTVLSSPSALGIHLMRRPFKEQRCQHSLYPMFVSTQHVIYDSSSAACKSRPVNCHQPGCWIGLYICFCTKIMTDYGRFHASVKLITKQKCRGLAENQFKLSSFLWSPRFSVNLRSENCQECCQPKAPFWYFPKTVQSSNKKPEWEKMFCLYHASVCSCILWKWFFKEVCSFIDFFSKRSFFPLFYVQ